MPGNPFEHHPELEAEVTRPEESFFREFSIEKLTRILEEKGLPTGWWHTDDEREDSRKAELAGRQDRDLWVFAYGSLMWDPAFHFSEVRRAHVQGYDRQFILKDIYGGRGTYDAPGIMAALDKGHGCDGLAFRITRDMIETETRILWQRECLTPAYHPVFVEADLGGSTVEALTFIADHEAELIDASLTRDEQVEYLATGAGFLGTSVDYLRSIVNHFERLGIQDAHAEQMLVDVERRLMGE